MELAGHYCERCLQLERNLADANEAVRGLSGLNANPNALQNARMELQLIRTVFSHHRRTAYGAPLRGAAIVDSVDSNR